jgi:DNA-binding CsgD family transcriptional regulator
MQTAVDSLTRQQRRCLEAVSRGLSSPEIAFELGIAENTVNAHIKAAVAKLGAPNRRHAAQMVIKYGLIVPDQKMASHILPIDQPLDDQPEPDPHRVEEARIEFAPFPAPVEEQVEAVGDDRVDVHRALGSIAKIAALLILLLLAFGPLAEGASKLANIIQPRH